MMRLFLSFCLVTILLSGCNSARVSDDAVKAHFACLIDAAGNLDDRVSDAASVGAAVQGACSGAEERIRSQAWVNFETALYTRQKFERSFARSAVEIVLLARKFGAVELRRRLATGEPLAG